MDAQLQKIADHLNLPVSTVAAAAVGSSSVLAIVLYNLLKSPSLPLPPSPPSLPIIGHDRLVDVEHPCQVYAELGKKYGDIIYLNTYGRHNVILNSVEDARELLDRRGAIYSSRPRTVLMGEMHGWGKMLFITPYGDRFRVLRRLFMQGFNAQACRNYHPIQTKQAGLYLNQVLENPTQFEQLMLAFSAGTILKSVFGYDLGTENDKFTAQGTQAAESLFSVGVPGSRMVDFFPSLQYLPSWLPGMSWKRRAFKDRHMADDVVDIPYNDIQKKRKAGEAPPSLISHLIDVMEAEGLESDQHITDIKNTGGVAFLGAVETTDAVIMSFILMMVLHPEEMKRAQQEIDTVVGPHRLPSLEDRHSLPYIDCIIKETTRICPPLEIDTPHVTVKDDVYKGYFIPKGTSVQANLWNYLRDPKVYKDPEVFRPSRFIEKVKNTESFERIMNSFDPEDPYTLIFGFGRRICPGRFFADSNVWLLISSMLAVFDIKPKKDPITGKDIKPKIEASAGFTNHVKPFDFEISPRDERSVKLIKDLATSG